MSIPRIPGSIPPGVPAPAPPGAPQAGPGMAPPMPMDPGMPQGPGGTMPPDAMQAAAEFFSLLLSDPTFAQMVNRLRAQRQMGAMEGPPSEAPAGPPPASPSPGGGGFREALAAIQNRR